MGIILLEMCVPFSTGMEVGEGRVKENEREKRERERERMEKCGQGVCSG